MQRSERKTNIIGGGIIAALETYFILLESKANHHLNRVTIYEKNPDISHTTTWNIVPSLTPDEILSVVSRGTMLIEDLSKLFSEKGGIRVDDVANVNNTVIANHFINAVASDGDNQALHLARTHSLLQLGKLSMEMWDHIYTTADQELQNIMRDANYHACKEISPNAPFDLKQGYRIDLIYKKHDAAKHGLAMLETYAQLGYMHCKILNPDEVLMLDPMLADFCHAHSTHHQWHQDTVAIWRPGGCLDTQRFLPAFYEYLRKQMGTYLNKNGKEKNRFKLKFGKKVEDVTLTNNNNHQKCVSSLSFFGGTIKAANNQYEENHYIFCPGESVGTLKSLGFDEPPYAGFAGATIRLIIPLTNNQQIQFSSLNHCMEVHQEGIVLAWQARIHEGNAYIGVGGTKAFYGDQQPNISHDFAWNRHLLQLNAINDVLPQLLSLAFGKETKGLLLTVKDLQYLVDNGIATRWVGRRSVAFDGFPTLGHAHANGVTVINARNTTHLSSGGVSFGPASVAASRGQSGELLSRVLTLSDSRRMKL